MDEGPWAPSAKQCWNFEGNNPLKHLPSRGLTYPTWGKGKSSSIQICHFWGICYIIFGHMPILYRFGASFFSLQFQRTFFRKFRGSEKLKEFCSIWSLRDGGLQGSMMWAFENSFSIKYHRILKSFSKNSWLDLAIWTYIYICIYTGFLSKQFLLLYVSLYWLVCDGILISWLHYLYILFVFALWNWEYKVSNMHRTTRGLFVHCYKWVVFRCPWSNIQIQNGVLGVKDSHL